MKGVVLWFTGLPAAGKTTLAGRVRQRLSSAGVACCVLDSDEVRSAITPKFPFDETGRRAFYQTLARLAAMLAEQGHAVLVPATASKRHYRELARSTAPAFMEIYVRTDATECAERDPKGLYAAAKAGTVRGLPGIDATYEVPIAPDFVASGGWDEGAATEIVEAVLLRRALGIASAGLQVRTGQKDMPHH